MRYPRIMEAIRSEIWAIKPSALQSIIEVVSSDNPAVRVVEEGTTTGHYALSTSDIVTDSDREILYERLEGVGIISVDGVIGKRLSQIETMCGGYDLDHLTQALGTAVNDPMVKSVLIDFNSPGGVVTGTPETAAVIRGYSVAGGGTKLIRGWNETQSESASCWLMSQCDEVGVTQSSSTGCVGVYSCILDSSAAFAAGGLKMNLIRDGKYKGAGVPGTPVEPDFLELMQKRVIAIGTQFRNAITAARPGVPVDAMQGQSFGGEEAVALGLADYVCASMAEFHRAIAASTR